MLCQNLATAVAPLLGLSPAVLERTCSVCCYLFLTECLTWHQPTCRVADGEAEGDNGLLTFADDSITAEEHQSAEGPQHADRDSRRCSSEAEAMQPAAATQLVAFPGINGPIPEGADSQKWYPAPPMCQVQIWNRTCTPHACLQPMMFISRGFSLTGVSHPYTLNAT